MVARRVTLTPTLMPTLMATRIAMHGTSSVRMNFKRTLVTAISSYTPIASSRLLVTCISSRAS
jgi:hypothetical protein